MEEKDWSKMGSMERRMLYKVMMMAGFSTSDVPVDGRRADAQARPRSAGPSRRQTLGGWAVGHLAQWPPPNFRGSAEAAEEGDWSGPPERQPAVAREDAGRELLKAVRERNGLRLQSMRAANTPSTPHGLRPLLSSCDPDREWWPEGVKGVHAPAGGKRVRVSASMTQTQMNSIRQRNSQRLAAAHAESYEIVTPASAHWRLDPGDQLWPTLAIKGDVRTRRPKSAPPRRLPIPFRKNNSHLPPALRDELMNCGEGFEEAASSSEGQTVSTTLVFIEQGAGSEELVIDVAASIQATPGSPPDAVMSALRGPDGDSSPQQNELEDVPASNKTRCMWEGVEGEGDGDKCAERGAQRACSQDIARQQAIADEHERRTGREACEVRVRPAPSLAIVWRPAPDSSSPRTRQSERRGSVALFGAQGGAAAKRAWAGPQGRNRVQIQGSDFNARKESKVVLTSIPMSDSSAFATPDVGVGSR